MAQKSNVAVVSPAINHELVSQLERCLKLARSGTVTSGAIAVCGVGEARTAYSGISYNKFALLGATRWVQRRIEDAIEDSE